MLEQAQIAAVINAQQPSFLGKSNELTRELLPKVPIEPNYATIITGIRRCGKSTLLLQLLKKNYQEAVYLNFEDIRLVNFELADFMRLKQEVDDRKISVLFLDEVQLIPKWEIFVHQLLREEYTVFVTGSNASLLSRELGTHLTGRHLSTELFPFSFKEYTEFLSLPHDADAIKSYLETGGFPEYVKNKNPFVLNKLMDDILVRDIAVRYAVRDVQSLRQLTLYLISNVGVPVSANKLAGLFGLKSTTTLLEYFSYLKDAYLLEFMPVFSYSLKTQSRNPRKVYAIDNGLITAVSASFTENYGRRLENMVYMHLRRQYNELYYYSEQNAECDFVVFKKSRPEKLIQVCYELDERNFKREYEGLLSAMRFFQLKEGFIITLDKKDRFEEEGGLVIHVVRSFEYFSSEP